MYYVALRQYLSILSSFKTILNRYGFKSSWPTVRTWNIVCSDQMAIYLCFEFTMQSSVPYYSLMTDDIEFRFRPFKMCSLVLWLSLLEDSRHKWRFMLNLLHFDSQQTLEFFLVRMALQVSFQTSATFHFVSVNLAQNLAACITSFALPILVEFSSWSWNNVVYPMHLVWITTISVLSQICLVLVMLLSDLVTYPLLILGNAGAYLW